MSGIMGMILGSGGDFSLSISPVDQSASSTTIVWTFAAEGVTVNGFAGGATYSWLFSDQLGGTFTIVSGAGTNTVTPRVSGVSIGEIATATIECTVTIGGISKTITTTLSYNRTL